MNPHVKLLDEIIKVCTQWKTHIEKKTTLGKELEKEFDKVSIIDILFGLFG